MRHVAILRTIRQVGRDSKTAYERARGAPCSSKLLGFGEVCRYKCRLKERVIPGTDKRWATGLWLGIDLRTGQYIFWDPKLLTVQYARTLLRLPDVEKWDREKASSMSKTPWSLHEDAPPEVRFPEREVPEGEVRPDALPQTRRVYIYQKDLDEYGYTTGCPKCEGILRGASGYQSSTLTHSERCRNRIMLKLAETPEGRLRLGAAAAQADTFLEETLRRNDDRLRPADAPQGEIDDRPLLRERTPQRFRTGYGPRSSTSDRSRRSSSGRRGRT